MVSHHTLGGCNLRPGDLLGSGTISGPQEDSRACLLEITRGGSSSIKIKAAAGGGKQEVERTYLQDGDTVVLRGFCESEGVGKIGFGECRGKLLPPK
jgi:fumarylacetoacetase